MIAGSQDPLTVRVVTPSDVDMIISLTEVTVLIIKEARG